MLKEDDVPVDVSAKNIRFLMESISMSVKDLAAIIEIDPISLYQFEKDNYEINFEEDCSYLIDIANYFAVKLDLLLYNDIENEHLLGQDWFQQLKNEMNFNQRADRKKFRREVMEGPGELIEGGTREYSMRRLLSQSHSSAKIRDKYLNLRDKGLIDKMNFFE